jgi:hypothetical protein
LVNYWDKYTEMHGQQNDKYTEMHGQQNVGINRQFCNVRMDCTKNDSWFNTFLIYLQL